MEVISECTKFCTFQLLSQSSSPLKQLDNFIIPLKLLIGFLLINLAYNVKMH